MARNRHSHRIRSFTFAANPATDKPYKISYSRAIALVAEELADWLTDDSIQLRPPIGFEREYKTREAMIARTILPGFARTALNRGRAGQFTIGYPIPYAFSGKYGRTYHD